MQRSKCSRWAAPVLAAIFVLASCSVPALAHPMGNFSVNHYAKITVGEKAVEVLYLIDMAEIPTYQEIRQFNLDPKAGEEDAQGYLATEDRLLGGGLSLQTDGSTIKLHAVSRHLQFFEGAGGLPTMKIALLFRGALNPATGQHSISYADNNFSGRAGWKEVVVVSDGATIVNSSAPSTDRSHELTIYSSDLVNSPPQQVSASVNYETARGAVSSAKPVEVNVAPRVRGMRQVRVPHSAPLPAAGRSPFRVEPQAASAAVLLAQPTPTAALQANTPRSRFTQLISTQGRLSLWVLISAAFIAAWLGALHALEPGHGKTIVAAYLVGSRGTAAHAVLLGVVVTLAHTAGVYLLGLVTLYASRYIVPEQLYPWLGAISGISVAGLGVFVLLRNLTAEAGDHSHTAGKPHSHWFMSTFNRNRLSGADEPGNSSSVSGQRPLSLRDLCMLGITGGIIPCPAALVVLLSAFSLHRIGFGLYLITAFSVGLAAVLVSIGLAIVYTRSIVASRFENSARGLRYLPFLSSVFMVVLGIGITISAIVPLHFAHALISRDKLLPFVTVILLGFFLGMRHSTDPDHVVAVSTIISRQGSVRSSAMIGLLWGLGHTLTIFLVGSAIIVFGVVIPARLGLSMEFCVALMLILLGILNLTGVMTWVNERMGSFGAAKRLSRREDSSLAPRESRLEMLLEKVVGKLGLYQTLRPLVVGLVHGLAGSAAVALLVLSTIKSPFWSTAYLLVFGFGTVAGMMIMTGAISMPLVFAGRKFTGITRHMTTASGLVSVAFGLFLVYQIGVIDGLFTAQPHWTPR